MEREIRSDKDKSGKGNYKLIKYLSLKSLVSSLRLCILGIDILLFMFIGVSSLLFFAIFFLVIVVIVAGAYIIILNDCKADSVIVKGNTVASSSSESSDLVVGDSSSAGQGDFTEDAKSWASGFNMTYIGDSLGVGVESYLSSYFGSANFDVDSSRGLVSIKGQRTGESGIQTLKRLAKEGKLKEHLVVALGTNNDMSLDAMQSFYSEIPSSVKTITWVLTASEGGVPNQQINSTIKDFVNSHDNMRYLDWKSYVDNHGGWGKFQGGDNIHMSPSGAEEYAKFQTQGLYDLYGKTSTKESKNSQAFGEVSYLANIVSSQLDKIASQKVYASDKGSKKNKSVKLVENGCGVSLNSLSSVSGDVSEETSSTSETSNESLGYLYKVPYTFTQGYGATVYASSGAYTFLENGWHSGVDTVASTGMGTEITSATSGEIFDAGTDPFGANYVVVKIDGGFLTYVHMSDNPRARWSVGQKVNVGDIIGLEGTTGFSNGSHLHFQYNPGNQWTLASLSSGFSNPSNYLKGVDPSIVEGKTIEIRGASGNPVVVTPE